jgi:hypothetical protein
MFLLLKAVKANLIFSFNTMNCLILNFSIIVMKARKSKDNLSLQ